MLRCEEKARLRYLELLASPKPDSPALSIGRAVHYGFETRSAVAAVDSLYEGRGPTWLEHEEEQLRLGSIKVRAMVEGGLARWDLWPSVTEKQFSVPFRNPETGRASTKHTLEGVFDGVFLPGGWDTEPEWPGSDRPVLLEIKTTSRLDSAYLERLDLDWQVSAYLAVAQVVYNAPVNEMVYRVVRKPSIRQRKDETVDGFAERLYEDYRSRPEFYFEEVVITRTDRQIERWLYEAWEVHERILRVERGGMTVRNPAHCLDFGRCVYFDLCRGVVGPSAFRVLKDAHPELAKENTK